MPTTKPKHRHKPDLEHPDRANDLATLARAKEQTRLHRYTVKVIINGHPVIKQVTKWKYNQLQNKSNETK